MLENLRILVPPMTSEPVTEPLKITLPRDEWEARSAAHRARVAPMAEAWLARRSRGEKHPVWDFLFTYYNFSPNKLMTWNPGIGEISNFKSQISNSESQISNLQPSPNSEPQIPNLHSSSSWESQISNLQSPISNDGTVVHVWPAITPRLARQAEWIARLCANVLSKPPRLGCFGLHEWAMVYQLSEEEIRHSGYQLRLSPAALEAFVKAQPICCSHFDAFRFFTPPAVPLNSLRPTLETRQDMEQSGCLHANMDLYKWAYKLWPWIGSDLLADAFEVAVASRAFDMRASPYELTALGFDPILIETDAGKDAYRREQLRLAAMAEPVRRKLLGACHLMPSLTAEGL